MLFWKTASFLGWCVALLMTFLWTGERQAGLSSAGEGEARAEQRILADKSAVGGAFSGETDADDARNSIGSETQDLKASSGNGNLNKVEKEVAALQDKLVKAEEQVSALAREAKLQAARADEAEDRVKQFRDSILGGFESTDEMVAMGARQLVNMQYGGLLGLLNVDDATKAEVASVIELAYLHNMKQGMDIVMGQSDQPMLSDNDYAQWMSEELSTILSPEDLKAFENYHSSLPGGMGGQMIEMQLKNFGGFAGDRNALIRDAILRAGASAGSWDPSQGMAGMYGAARETLQASLAPEEMAAYDRFVEQQLSFMKMAEFVTTGDDAQGPGNP
jgi:hypothetical protein